MTQREVLATRLLASDFVNPKSGDPGMDNWDMALLKVTHFTESNVLEMRLETFNTLNHTQFFGPTSVNANISSTSFGQVVSAVPSRVMQVAAKFSF